MSTPVKFREEARKGQFKKGVTAEDARKKRTDLSNLIRKEKKETRMAKKRQQINEAEVPQLSKITVEKIQSIANDIINGRPNKYDSLKQIRQLLSIERNPPISEVIATGVVPYVVSLMSSSEEDNRMKFEAAWVLTNIASGTTQQTQYVVENGAVPSFVELLKSNDTNLIDQAVWALGNIAGDSSKCRDCVLQNNAMPLILEQIMKSMYDSNCMSLIRNATWTVSNLCRGRPQPDFSRVSIALPVLEKLIQTNDRDIVADACWALSYLSDGDGEQITTVLSSGVCPKLVQLLSSSYVNVITPALRTIGNFVSGDDKQTQVVLDANVLPSLLYLLSNSKSNIVKEACWTISNIAAGTQSQVKQLFNQNIMPTIISLLKGSYVIKKEAAWVIANATSQDIPENTSMLVSYGVIPALCDALKVPDVEVKEVVLNALNHILRVGVIVRSSANSDTNPYVKYIIQCGGGDTLESLQDHPNHSISEIVRNLIEKYFPLEDDYDDSTNPIINSGGVFEFGMLNPSSSSSLSPPSLSQQQQQQQQRNNISIPPPPPSNCNNNVNNYPNLFQGF